MSNIKISETDQEPEIQTPYHNLHLNKEKDNLKENNKQKLILDEIMKYPLPIIAYFNRHYILNRKVKNFNDFLIEWEKYIKKYGNKNINFKISSNISHKNLFNSNSKKLTLNKQKKQTNENYNKIVFNKKSRSLKNSFKKGSQRLSKSFKKGSQRLSKSLKNGSQRLSKSVKNGSQRLSKSFKNGSQRLSKSVKNGSQRLLKSVKKGSRQNLENIKKTQKYIDNLYTLSKKLLTNYGLDLLKLNKYKKDKPIEKNKRHINKYKEQIKEINNLYKLSSKLFDNNHGINQLKKIKIDKINIENKTSQLRPPSLTEPTNKELESLEQLQFGDKNQQLRPPSLTEPTNEELNNELKSLEEKLNQENLNQENKKYFNRLNQEHNKILLNELLKSKPLSIKDRKIINNLLKIKNLKHNKFVSEYVEKLYKKYSNTSSIKASKSPSNKGKLEFNIENIREEKKVSKT